MCLNRRSGCERPGENEFVLRNIPTNVFNGNEFVCRIENECRRRPRRCGCGCNRGCGCRSCGMF